MLSPVEEIKSRLDIVEFIQSYVRLQKAGINYRANCPFHGEKTPSFFVSPTRQIWHCFGCGKGGDVFKFVMEIEGHEFPEALALLASRAGIILKREDPRIRSERNRLYQINEEAAHIFEKNLSLTPAARDYLKKRGVKEETIKEFRIGFAPQSWDFLLKSLTANGFKKEEAGQAGLVIQSEDRSSWYDRFRSRIMFPIGDANGRIVGFGGRIFELDSGRKTQFPDRTEAKYMNTPQTLIYDKSRILYGFEKAKQEIRAKNQAVVVEGYMDCVMSQQAGVKNTIAVSGTALTPQQLKIVRRLCDTLLCSFDTDAAGDSATKRSLALAAQFEFERRVVHIPSGKDPADTVCESPEAWQEAVAGAKRVVAFYFEKASRECDVKTAEGKKSMSVMVLSFVGELADEIEKAHWVGELARRMSVSEDAVWKELKRRRITPEGKVAEEKNSAPVSRRDLLEERFLTLLAVMSPEVRTQELEGHTLFFSLPAHNELFSFLMNEPLSGRQAEEKNNALEETLQILKFKGEALSQLTGDPKEEFILCTRELEKHSVKERLLKIGEEIERREKEGSISVVTTLLEDFRTMTEKLKSLTN